MQFSDRLNLGQTYAIRELFKLLPRPDIISFAGGFPDTSLFDVEGIQDAIARALHLTPQRCTAFVTTSTHMWACSLTTASWGN